MQLAAISQGPIGTLRQTFSIAQGPQSFAHTNALLMRPVALPPLIAHFWVLADTVILGMQDVRLPHFSAAVNAAHAAGYATFVRNAGGLGVISDAGVLNFSLFMPAAAALTIPVAYQLMATLIAQALPEANVQVGEVTHSYCPGSYDLSINGQKFAGLAQRRTSRGIVVMAYLSAAGDQPKRGAVMRNFYAAGGGTARSHFAFPTVDPSSMATLSTLLHQPINATMLQARLVDVLAKQGLPLDPLSVPQAIQQPAYKKALAQAAADIAARNETLPQGEQHAN